MIGSLTILLLMGSRPAFSNLGASYRGMLVRLCLEIEHGNAVTGCGINTDIAARIENQAL
jgi:hypothetical protein